MDYYGSSYLGRLENQYRLLDTLIASPFQWSQFELVLVARRLANDMHNLERKQVSSSLHKVNIKNVILRAVANYLTSHKLYQFSSY